MRLLYVHKSVEIGGFLKENVILSETWHLHTQRVYVKGVHTKPNVQSGDLQTKNLVSGVGLQSLNVG